MPKIGEKGTCSAPEEARVPYPEGLRVMAIDGDRACLMILVTVLKKCQYEVTAQEKATEALEMLRENKDKYDIVVTAVVGLDMDGFSLLEIIGLEMDIPVIMVSASDDQKIIMKAILHGARDFLMKPVRIQELKNIWQHVLRKQLCKQEKSKLIVEKTAAQSTGTKRPVLTDEEAEAKDESNCQADNNASVRKRTRVSWSPELHLNFVNAVQQLGINCINHNFLPSHHNALQVHIPHQHQDQHLVNQVQHMQTPWLEHQPSANFFPMINQVAVPEFQFGHMQPENQTGGHSQQFPDRRQLQQQAN
ncbi:hypothetical protein NL676_036439 [Syzygium grande]|nr:hypothetical protein NL676_036439 [Syzygium grande]